MHISSIHLSYINRPVVILRATPIRVLAEGDENEKTKGAHAFGCVPADYCSAIAIHGSWMGGPGHGTIYAQYTDTVYLQGYNSTNELV